MRYIVTNSKHVFYGHNFHGEPIRINDEDRIWDKGSVGRSYPSKDCQVVDIAAVSK